jgi:YD repeat-containing protein
MDIPVATLQSADLNGSDSQGVGIGTATLSSFPTVGSSFAILSTGLATSADAPNTEGDLSFDLAGVNNADGHDMVQLDLLLQVPSDRNCLRFDFAFFSEEFPEFVGTAFNDTFTASLDGSNIAFDPAGNLISINTVLGMSTTPDTTYDGATALLQAATPVVPGTLVQLVFTIEDQGDSFLDSAVFLDRFRWSMTASCTVGSDNLDTLPDDRQRVSEDLCTVQSECGGPINTRTGNLWTSATDLVVTSPGPPLVWQRTYSSQATDEISTPLGVGWQHRYATRLITETMPGGEAGTVIVVSPKGNWLRYADEGNGQFTPTPGVYHTLVQGSGVYTQTRRDQTRHVFDATTGHLTQLIDPQGRALTLSYTGDRVTQIADAAHPTDRQLTLGYDATNTLITSVSDGTRSVQYTYDGNNDLTEVRDVMDRPTTYTYQNHLLTRIENALGQPLEQTVYEQPYTADSKAISQTLQDGRQLRLNYLQNSTVITTTGVDGHQEVEEVFYAPTNSMTGRQINGMTVMGTAHDANFSPTELVDGNGHTTQTRFTPAGLPEMVTNALGETTQVAYTTRNQPTVITDTLGRRTDLAYDAAGNLIRQTTGITTAFPLGFTTIYTYTADHWLAAQQGPDGVVVAYTYDSLGQVTQSTLGAGTPEAQVTSYGYDTLGRVVTTTVGVGTPLERVDVTDYNADDTVARTIQNYQDGVFDPATPDADIITTYGYDTLGRQVWVQDVLGHTDVTHYDTDGRMDWTAQNLVPFQVDADGLPVAQPFDPATPDQNVTTFYGYD